MCRTQAGSIFLPFASPFAFQSYKVHPSRKVKLWIWCFPIFPLPYCSSFWQICVTPWHWWMLVSALSERRQSSPQPIWVDVLNKTYFLHNFLSLAYTAYILLYMGVGRRGTLSTPMRKVLTVHLLHTSRCQRHLPTIRQSATPSQVIHGDPRRRVRWKYPSARARLYLIICYCVIHV